MHKSKPGCKQNLLFNNTLKHFSRSVMTRRFETKTIMIFKKSQRLDSGQSALVRVSGFS